MTKNVKFHDLAGDSLKRILRYTSEAKMQSLKNNISCFNNLQNELLVLIFVWFPRFLNIYCKKKIRGQHERQSWLMVAGEGGAGGGWELCSPACSFRALY